MDDCPLGRTRKLTILGQDPGMTYRGGALTVELEIPAERLTAGPRGARVHVIDFDASTNTLYQPSTSTNGKDPFADITDTDRLVRSPAFHAQNSYAIIMATLARFEHALGRRASFAFPGGGSGPGAAPGRGHVVKVAPHAFAEANAFYSRRDEGLLFGYFAGRRGTIFTCLAHDVVAHETTHALVDGLRPRYSDPSSPDQAAFHEGFSDVVALLSVFRHRRVIEATLQTRGSYVAPEQLTAPSLRRSTLFGLAEQMGQEMSAVRGQALRCSAQLKPGRGYLDSEEYEPPHKRGEVFTAAMLNAFLEVWIKRLGPLGLKENKPVDRSRVIEEGAAAADHLLTMAIRALDYSPPVDLQFSDYLTALLTADARIYPDDTEFGYRSALLDWFGKYGIEPIKRKGGGSAGTWAPPTAEVRFDRNHFESLQHDPDEAFHFVWENREALGLHPTAYTYVPAVRPCARRDVDGFSLHETIAEYVQILDLTARELGTVKVPKPKDMPGDQPVRLYGGGALVFDEFGRLKFHIGSGVASAKQGPRLEYLWKHGFFERRRSLARRFAHLHLDRALQRNPQHVEGW